MMASQGLLRNPRDWLLQQRAFMRYQIRRLGRGNLAGMLLIAAALVLQLTLVRGTRQETRKTQEQIEALRSGSAKTNESRPTSAKREAGVFPGPEARESILVRIYALAGQQGLSLENGEYRLIPDTTQKATSGNLAKYQLSLPLRGQYPALRAWLANVMNEMPTLALDDFSLKRDTVANPEVEARVRFTLYFEER